MAQKTTTLTCCVHSLKLLPPFKPLPIAKPFKFKGWSGEYSLKQPEPVQSKQQHFSMRADADVDGSLLYPLEPPTKPTWTDLPIIIPQALTRPICFFRATPAPAAFAASGRASGRSASPSPPPPVLLRFLGPSLILQHNTGVRPSRFFLWSWWRRQPHLRTNPTCI